MADKIKKARSRYEDDERYTRHDDEDEDDFDEDEDYDGRRRSNSNRGGGGSKYEKLYGVLDALVDQIDMPRNRIRAIKFGIRALGELLSETENKRRSGGGNRGGRSSHSSERGSHASGGGERGVSKSHKGE